MVFWLEDEQGRYMATIYITRKATTAREILADITRMSRTGDGWGGMRCGGLSRGS